jgi:hypothetical protein
VNWQVTIRPAAKADMVETRDWYEAKRSGLGDDFLAAVAEAYNRLEESADRFAIYYRDFRRVLTKRFPYNEFYRIEGDTVIGSGFSTWPVITPRS